MNDLNRLNGGTKAPPYGFRVSPKPPINQNLKFKLEISGGIIPLFFTIENRTNCKQKEKTAHGLFTFPHLCDIIIKL
jgi:hypothetical protein